MYKWQCSPCAGFELEDGDPFAEELAMEAAEKEHRRSQHMKKLEDLELAADGIDISRHFSYYAWEGGSGELRWKHEVLIVLPVYLA